MSATTLPPPGLQHVCDVRADVGPPIDVGETAHGRRRMVPILGGVVTGPKVNGKVMAGGIDYQMIRADNTAEIEARYVIETTDGARLFVQNIGLRHGPPEAIARLLRGEAVDPALIYFRAAPKIESAHPAYAWMEKALFLSVGARFPDAVALSFYEVT